MSRRKDGGAPRRKHGNCNKPLRQAQKEHGRLHDGLGDLGESSSSSSKGPRERPPPQLKGKALGLWYRDRQVKTNREEEEARVPEIRLPAARFEEIETLLFDARKMHTEDTDMLDSDFKLDFRKKVQETFYDKISKNLSLTSDQADEALDRELKRKLVYKIENDKKYQEMLNFREKLPCFKKKDKLVRAIADNQVIVISGETGCGKTTQIAQFVLDDEVLNGRGSLCTIICTQPRRISAISVAERVAAERNEQLGEGVGYQIRLEKNLPNQKKASLTFVTTGILLQYLQSDPTLSGISHLFLDEVHERDILCDFAIACLKQIIAKRPSLKVILMSATLNAERFSAYFNSAPCIHVPGFTYEVEEIYLDQIIEKTAFKFQNGPQQNQRGPRKFNSNRDADFQHVVMPHVRQLASTRQISQETASQLSKPESELLNADLVVAVIQHICLHEAEGAILVFLPGLSDIQKVNKLLLSKRFFSDGQFLIILLHSTLPTLNQRKVFDRPRKGVRKIIIATNIAETSITIDDVVFVVDSGYIKMTNFNMELNLSSLDSQWISVANARQRRGRAGRVQPGKCFKLYTSAREMIFAQYPLPEMQRTRLEEIVLQVKTLQLGKVAPFLQTVIDPPDAKAVNISLQMLKTLNALDENENLTPLGFHLAKLPLDPQTGKMILMAALFGCVDPVLSIAAALSFKDPFMTPLGKEQAVRRVKAQLADGERSDHLILSNAMRKWEAASRDGTSRSFCYDHFLSENTLFLLKDMKRQFARHLHEMNFLATPHANDENGNINSRNVELVKAVVCAGLYPNVAIIKSVKRECVLLKTREHLRVELHPRSICCKEVRFNSPLFVYHMMLKSSAIFLHDVTVVSPWALLFFGERLDIVEVDRKHAIRVDQLVKFNAFKKTGVLVQKLRKHLDWIMGNAISNPGVIDWNEKSMTTSILKAIVKLITSDNEEMMMMQLDEWE